MRTKQMEPFGMMIEASQPGQNIKSLDTERLLEIFVREHLLVLRGFQTFGGKDEFADYCERFGEISVWPFGKVLELIEEANPNDHIFDHSYVPLHWDGMYRPEVPEFQIFHCVHAISADEGGRTTFSHTKRVLENASLADLDLWGQVQGVYHREMEFYHSKTVAPLISKHPAHGFNVMRYCEPPLEGDSSFINPSDLKFEGTSQISALLRSLRAALYASKNFYAHAWKQGDVVIADNYTLLHGREAFTSGAPRHLRRVHVLGSPALTNPHLVFHT